jgi:hypothetical protein
MMRGGNMKQKRRMNLLRAKTSYQLKAHLSWSPNCPCRSSRVRTFLWGRGKMINFLIRK